MVLIKNVKKFRINTDDPLEVCICIFFEFVVFECIPRFVDWNDLDFWTNVGSSYPSISSKRTPVYNAVNAIILVRWLD